MKRPPKTPTDPLQLRAIVDLRRAGWPDGDVMAHLGISRRTYFRRLDEIRRKSDRRDPFLRDAS